ncbi:MULTISPECIES: amino acid ABC transporter permease [Kribbella]|uniref:Amino acid ABC transporter membrane protein (PAAT family) n=1 Tax=Kribbella pratensis TaxID=2512112 RepID=A0ABY2F8K9_9ACTN|nr:MULTISPECIES: amino acid ABC transporter permease [Kribbella]TDW86916.1 amino acid ABC transporter membrane protein (PAAT family) [Kribbella pratensis]TDW91761.1 amino acid ABC transporter membrane protein (PAAT family) [Kribbella sp. VKM Ac-2566]
MTVSDAVVEKRRGLSPRQRAQRSRGIQYAVLIVIVVVAAFTANWGQIASVFFKPEFVKSAFTSGLPGAFLKTIEYTAGAFVIGLLGGTLLALMRLSRVAPYRWFATAYIEFFRGLPAIVVFVAFSLLPLAFADLVIPLDPYGTVWLALGIVAAAYMAEVIRAGIQAVPKGQIEAARSLGMPAGVATRKIVLPQAFRIVLPPLANDLILLVKDSSLVFIIGTSAAAYELTGFGRDLANTESNLTPLVTAGFCYLVITLPLGLLVRWLEAKAARAH